MTVPRPRRTAFCASALLAALVLSGCARDAPEPKVADPTEAASSPVATPSDNTETPEEFIERWAEAERDMLNSGKTEAYSAMTKSCESCGDLVERVTRYYADGGWVQWDGMTVQRTEKRSDLVYEVWTMSTPTRYKSSASADVQGYDGGRTKYQLTLTRTSKGLVLSDLVLRPL